MNKDLIRNQFGTHAEKYVTSVVHAKGKSLQRLVALANPEKHWQALDIATATGHTAFTLAPHVGTVIASDLVPEMLEVAQAEARKKNITNVRFEQADAENLPFEAESFDLVTCRIAAHHFPNVNKFLEEVSRVLKPGGKFILVDNVGIDDLLFPDEKSSSEKDFEEASQAYNQFEAIRDPSHNRALTIGEWSTELRQTGFEITAVEVLDKDMEFDSWVQRLNTPEDGIRKLRSILDGDIPLLRRYLQSRELDGKIWFTIKEATIAAEKSV